jgi:hypothetical protein
VIQGVGDWLSEGLAEPERVAAAMDDYRKGSSRSGSGSWSGWSWSRG